KMPERCRSESEGNRHAGPLRIRRRSDDALRLTRRGGRPGSCGHETIVVRKLYGAQDALAIPFHDCSRGHHRKAEIEVVEARLRHSPGAKVLNGVQYPDRCATDRRLDAALEPQGLAAIAALHHLSLTEEHGLSVLPVLTIGGELGGRKREAAVQRIAIDGLTDMVEAACDEKAAEAPSEAVALISFRIEQGWCAKARSGLPGDLDALP